MGFDDLIHGEGVDDFGAVERQFGGFAWRDRVKKTRRGHFARVGGEYAVDFLPDLQCSGFETNGDQSCAKVGVAPANLVQ